MNALVLLVILVAETILFASLGQSFGAEALGGLLVQAAPVLIISWGMTLVLLTSGIDLSVGSLTALVACFLGLFPGDLSFWGVAVPLGLAVGAALGFVNGVLVGGIDMPPIIATLATMILYRGACFVLLRDTEQSPFLDVPGYTFLAEPFVVLGLTAALYGAGALYFQRSRWRRELRFLGGNRVAARYAGLPVGRRLVEVYTLVGFLCALAALAYTARNGSVSASSLTELELKVIVAVVLGGTRVTGGAGSLIGSLLGVLVIAVLDEGLRGPALKMWGDRHLPFQVAHLRPVLLGLLLVAGARLHRARPE